MNLLINGQKKCLSSNEEETFLKGLIINLGYQPELVVVELNRKIIHSEDWEQQIINDGDQLEIVTIVGGGHSSRQS